jgi:DnaK suppressor protein
MAASPKTSKAKTPAKTPVKAATTKAAPKATPKKAAPTAAKSSKPTAIVELPKGYKPSLKEEYMCPEQLLYFKQKLAAWRAELIAESNETLQHLKEENWHEADIADRASIETEAGVELRTRNRYLKLISKINAALWRIDNGDYGYCEETGEPIGLLRLEARPIATLCIEAQERHERMEKQYSDED